jgi:hypothetical protein
MSASGQCNGRFARNVNWNDPSSDSLRIGSPWPLRLSLAGRRNYAGPRIRSPFRELRDLRFEIGIVSQSTCLLAATHFVNEN